MVKVVHVSDCFLPRLGGIETQVAELTRMQQAAGHDVEVVTATPDRAGRSGASPVPVHRVVAPLPWELPVHPLMGHHLERLYEELRPDVVHVHVGAVSPFAWSGVREAAQTGIPTVVTVHSMWDVGTATLYRLLDATTGWTRWRGVCTAVSEAAAEPVRQVVEGRVPVHVVANGITTGQWRLVPALDAGGTVEPAAASADGDGTDGHRADGHAAERHAADRHGPGVRSSDRPVHVVAVGRLAPRKQPLTLLRILRAAQDVLAVGSIGPSGARRPRLRATIVGDGPALPLLRWYLRRRGMDSWVELTGRLDRDEVRTVLENADLFVAPARRESFGLAALEARMAGVPVVGYADSGVSSFVVSEKEGLLGRSPAELAAAVARLANDHALRSALAAHNQASVPVHCTWPVVLADFDERYAQAMTRARVAPVA
jgi:phosphatidylinositol alpha 1,6-mannosyltransferase